jgi:hypothetical protein
MAYIIGNTTVITNNAALGSVSGNSLNLANNNNIPAGGATINRFTSTTNTSVAGSTNGFVIAQAGGGGGGWNQNSYGEGPGGSGWGAAGAGGIAVGDVSGGGNATFTVGAGGQRANSRNARGQSGGASNFSYNFNMQCNGGGGGAAGQNVYGPGSPPSGAGFGGTRMETTSGNSGQANAQNSNIFDGFGRGGRDGGIQTQPQAGQAGIMFMVG